MYGLLDMGIVISLIVNSIVNIQYEHSAISVLDSENSAHSLKKKGGMPSPHLSRRFCEPLN